MHDHKISVIVPTYNNAQWISRSLDSLLAQTYGNLEIVVVNDGSYDNTEEILNAYAAKHDRMKAIHKENGGVTSARLRGVAEATGEWIGFVDADDFVEPQMYQRLMENADAYQADISHCGYQRNFPDRKTEYHGNAGNLYLQDRLTALRDLLEERLVEPGLCSKLFKRELFQGLEEWMDSSIKNNEDMLMNFYLFSRSEKSIYEDVCPYHYVLRDSSASRRKLNAHRIYDPIRVREIILEACEPELRTDAKQALLRTCLFVYALLALETGREYSAHRQKVRQILAAQKEDYHILTKRNQILAELIRIAPWLFRMAFAAYVFCFRKGHYE